MRLWRALWVVAFGACGSPGADRSAVAPPAAPEVHVPPAKSVILITVDTLRADVLGIAGGAAHTPTIDALAKRGWTFDHCYANSMLTNPSHASIMTSLYPRDHGVYDNESGIADGARTLATAMQRQGRRTIAVVNFAHLNPEVANLGQGFDRFIKALKEERRAPETSRAALAAIDELDAGEEFFLWIHYPDPHAPYDPPDDHRPRKSTATRPTPMSVAASLAPGFQKNNAWFKKAFTTYKHVGDLEARYVAEVEATDAGLEVLLAGLSERRRRDRTTVVLTSDHGESFGEHRLYFNHGGLYDKSVHVPLIVAVPGATPLRLSGQVESVDIAPTLLALIGAPRWEPMRGRSLVELARGLESPREFVYSEHMLGQQVAVRGHDGALILHRKNSAQFPGYRFVSGKREVYNLAADPEETEDLGPSGPLFETLDAALQGYLQAGLQFVARPALGQDRDSLRRLGYLE
ncbi:MAG: sulfatase [Deltaproteobacteria bacterium]|nr:sulfatase [Deltaproteobacteria bacterium]